MPKIISTFGSKRKTLSAQEEKELLKIMAEGIKKIKEINPNAPQIAQLREEIQSPNITISQSELKEKKKALQILEKKDIYQVCQELKEQLDPQKIEQQKKKKPTKTEKQKWEEFQKIYWRVMNAGRSLLWYNKSFVKYIEKRYYYSGKVDHEDLTTEGVFSLLRAIEKFDSSTGNRLSTLSGYYICQSITTFIKKNQLVYQSSSSGEEKKLIFYDNAYQSDKESNTYSLMDILSDPEASGLETEKIRQQDIKRQMNDLLNSLELRENFVLRLFYKVIPTTLFDIYCITPPNEKITLKKAFQLSDKTKFKLLQKVLLEDKKIRQVGIVKKYLTYFSTPHKSAATIAPLLHVSEKEVSRLKANGLEKMKKLAQERNLHLLI